ncbi:MAG: SLBB domain-containing protein [Beijerinckiaceae bacterium]|nr:SLBB domain-containing protein [Beijerinckiaceae bacterium]
MQPRLIFCLVGLALMTLAGLTLPKHVFADPQIPDPIEDLFAAANLPDAQSVGLRLLPITPIDLDAAQAQAGDEPTTMTAIESPPVPLVFKAFRLSGPISLPRSEIEEPSSDDVTGTIREPELRIGDILTISLPGETAFNKDFKVDRRGQLTLPEAGILTVAGMPLDKARDEIKVRLSKVYRDLGRLSVVIKERKLLINVLGYVKTPGPVELPGDASVQTAITAAGGLAQGAQLDRLKVRRGDEEIQFDYKHYLDSGDVTILPELRPLDIIFVPASPRTGNVQIDFDGRTLAEAGDGAEDRSAIKIFGEVNKPGTFAYKDGINVVDVIMRAGGVSRYSTIEQIHVINQGQPTLFNLDTYLQNGTKASLPELKPGATIFVPRQNDQVKQGQKTVFVMGEVQKPGGFDATNEVNLIGLLANAGGPTRYAETNQIRVLRADGTTVSFNLPAYTEGKGGSPPTVRPGDAIFVPGKVENNDQSWLKISPSRAVQMIGAVNRPGRVEWSDEMTILDLISQAGGPTAVGDVANIQILTHQGDNAKSIRFNLEKFIAEGGSLASLPKIRAGYVVLMPVLPVSPNDTKGSWARLTSDVSIYIMGQVGIPGRYAFNNGLHFLDILSAANGPTSAADIRNIRVSHRGRKGSYVSKVDLARYFETGDDSLLPKVRPGDVIFVPDRNKEWVDERKEATIRVLGAVAKPGRYRWADDLTILDLLAEAGGPRSDALDTKILVVNFKADGEQARLFNLLDFAKTADITKLPLIRAGDLVYVPNTSQSELKVFTDILQSGSTVASLGALIYTLGR